MASDIATVATSRQSNFAIPPMDRLCLSGNNPPMAGHAPNRIRELREARRLTLEQVAERVGTSASQIYKLETGRLRLKVDWMRKLAPVFGVDPADLLPRESPDASAASVPGVVKEAIPAPNAARRYVGVGNGHTNTDMIPIRSGARGGNQQEMFLTDVVGYTARPSSLKDVKDAYAIYMVGDSMSPRYEQGWLLHIHPHKPAKPGRDVVVTKHDDVVLVKTLASWKGGRIELRSINQYDFPEPIVLDEQEVRHVHVIVGADQEG